MKAQERQNLFVELIDRHQSSLYGYIYAVVRNRADTDDLYQSVCLVLWQKFESFQPGSNFFAWARQTARNKIGDFVRRKRLPTYANENLINTLAEISIEPDDADATARMAALRRCRQKLDIADDDLLQLRYVEELSTVEIADRLQRLQPSVSRSLHRVRRWLLECIEMEMTRHKPSSKRLACSQKSDPCGMRV